VTLGRIGPVVLASSHIASSGREEGRITRPRNAARQPWGQGHRRAAERAGRVGRCVSRSIPRRGTRDRLGVARRDTDVAA
jgi:hypothetical protein